LAIAAESAGNQQSGEWAEDRAVDETWSGLKFYRRKAKTKATRTG
jgi:hypothetical protein